MRIDRTQGFRVSGIQKQQQAEQGQKAQNERKSLNLKLENPNLNGSNDRMKSIRKQIENVEKQIQLIKESDMPSSQKKERLETMEDQLKTLNEQLMTAQMEETKKAQEEMAEKKENDPSLIEEESGVSVELSYGLASADGYMKSIEKPMQVYKRNMTQFDLSVGKFFAGKGPLDTGALHKALNSVTQFVAPKTAEAGKAMNQAAETEGNREEEQTEVAESAEE